MAWVHKILALSKNEVGGVGRNFGVGNVGLRCFDKMVFFFFKICREILCCILILNEVPG